MDPNPKRRGKLASLPQQGSKWRRGSGFLLLPSASSTKGLCSSSRFCI